MRNILMAGCLLLAATSGLHAPALHAGESDADRATRWHDLATAVFGARPVTDGSAMLSLDAPPRALDAALVPISITFTGPQKVKSLTLLIDDNPAPVAGTFQFGPLADPSVIKTRVRVDQYTLIHAVAETTDGKLYAVSRFIKAAGGCSAPANGDQAEAMARLGRMKLRLQPAGRQLDAELLISHPNNNGMQMNPVTRLYTPARFVQNVTVREGGALVFKLEGDISLSENPEIGFAFTPQGGAPLDVEVDDSAKSVFKQSFPVTPQAS